MHVQPQICFFLFWALVCLFVSGFFVVVVLAVFN